MSAVYSLYLVCPVVERMSLWVLLWVAVTTDFVVKFATVIIKAVIALLPRQILPLKKKVFHSAVFLLYNIWLHVYMLMISAYCG